MTTENVVDGEKTRILLIEDHASFRQALAFMFEREEEFAVVGQAGTLAEAREFLNGSADATDVAVCDLALPDGDGYRPDRGARRQGQQDHHARPEREPGARTLRPGGRGRGLGRAPQGRRYRRHRGRG